MQLRRARFGYQRWLEQEHIFRTKGIQGETWVNLGPNNGAGRCVALAPHPTTVGTLLVGAAGGGVWRTRDGGETWEPLTDGMPDLSVGAVTYAPSNPDIVYVGTGEGGYAVDFIAGIGLLRSDDGGDTWTLPTEVVASQFYRISVDPRNPDVLLAGTNEGLLRSEDGGVSWTVPIPARSGTGARELAVTDVVRSAQNPDRMYAAIWSLDASCPTGTARVMRSDDGGLTWTPAAMGLPTPTSDYSLNRLGLALSPNDDSRLVVAMNRSGDGPPVEVYATTNAGGSWTKKTDPDAYLGAQGWYDNTITIRPGDDNFVLGAGVYYAFSTNGGITWTTRNPYQTSGLPHVDFHDLQWQGGTLWTACDGGVWKSPDGGTTWIDCTDGLITRQYYGIAVDPVHRNRLLAGAQDNGTDRRRDVGDDSWDPVLGGDGFECAINPLVPDVVYATVYNTSIYRSTQGGANFRDVSPRYGGSESAPFLTPLTLHPAKPWEVFTGTNRVWFSPDAGDSWQALSTDVTNGSWNGSTVAGISGTLADDDVLMVGKGSDVYRTENGGQTWQLTTRGSGGLPGYRVLNVEVSPFDDEIALACLGTTSGTPLYRTTDGGLTWEPSATGLPSFPVQVARWDPTDPSVVYAGTDVGCYRSTDGGVTWAQFGQGLPSVSVHDIRILPDGSMLRVGTHGRGVWELEIPRDPNEAPAVQITSASGTVVLDVGDTASFTGTATDPDGDTLQTRWVFTDDWSTLNGASGAGTVTSSGSHLFDIGGTYLAALVAEDGKGGQGIDSVAIRVNDSSDSCQSPRQVPSSGPFPVVLMGNNTVAGSSTTDPAPTCVSNPADSKVGTWGSMWFEFTPAESHTYSISTCGSGADTVLSVWTGDACGPLTPLAGGCNDDDEMVHCSGGRTDSYLELDLDAGTTYRIMVGSYASSSKGRFALTIDCADCPHELPDRLYLVPAAARSEGSNGTYWRTDVVLTNRGEDEVSARLAFLYPERDNATADEVQVSVPAEGSLALDDVVSQVLNTYGSGGIRILADGDLTVTSRTYTDSADGTYGQFIPAVEVDDAIQTGYSARLIGLAENAAFRTNLGMVNTSADPVSVEIDLLDSSGAVLATHDVSLDPYGWTQINRIFHEHGFSDVSGAQAVVRVTGSGSVLPYGSVVDNATGDPVYVAPVAEASDSQELWVAAAAHLPGTAGSQWRTDLTLANTGTEQATVQVQYLPADTDNSAPDQAQLTVPAGGTVTAGDVIGTLFSAQGKGALRLVTTGAPIQVVSRTYNQTPDGTYGQFIPAVPATTGLGDSDTGLLVQLRDDSGFRTNVGVVNLTGASIQVEATFLAADGSTLGDQTWTVPAYGYHQQDSAIPGPSGQVAASAVLHTLTPGGRYLAYASVVDNGSGDPVFVPAVVSD